MVSFYISLLNKFFIRQIMGNILYSELSGVCHEFYRSYFPHQKIAYRIDGVLKRHGCKKIVFFGGLVEVAKILQEKGYAITFADYTKEMVEEARKFLGNAQFIKTDMRNLRLKEKQDAIVLMGRIFTYMYTDNDALMALRTFKNNLRPGGILLMDNYETGKIEKGKYFNGTVNVGTLKRKSRMRRIKKAPALYAWNCVYEGDRKKYRDSNHILRAFTREEIKGLVERSGLGLVKHAPNFEKRSFVTIARNSV